MNKQLVILVIGVMSIILSVVTFRMYFSESKLCIVDSENISTEYESLIMVFCTTENDEVYFGLINENGEFILPLANQNIVIYDIDDTSYIYINNYETGIGKLLGPDLVTIAEGEFAEQPIYFGELQIIQYSINEEYSAYFLDNKEVLLLDGYSLIDNNGLLFRREIYEENFYLIDDNMQINDSTPFINIVDNDSKYILHVVEEDYYLYDIINKENNLLDYLDTLAIIEYSNGIIFSLEDKVLELNLYESEKNIIHNEVIDYQFTNEYIIIFTENQILLYDTNLNPIFPDLEIISVLNNAIIIKDNNSFSLISFDGENQYALLDDNVEEFDNGYFTAKSNTNFVVLDLDFNEVVEVEDVCVIELDYSYIDGNDMQRVHALQIKEECINSELLDIDDYYELSKYKDFENQLIFFIQDEFIHIISDSGIIIYNSNGIIYLESDYNKKK